MAVPAIIDAVMHELGSLILSFLPLRDVAVSTFAADRTLNKVSRERIEELWPTLSPLLDKPFMLTRQELLARTTLTLGFRELGDTGLQKLSSAVAIGTLSKLTGLHLIRSQISDRGMASLSGVIADGALTKLTSLNLAGNQISDHGMVCLSDAITRGALARLELLILRENQIGDVGLTALALACANSHALRALRTLYLFENMIGDEGMNNFSASIAHGGLASLSTLHVDGGLQGTEHPGLQAACFGRGITLP